MTQTRARARSVEVLRGGGNESVGVLSIDLFGRLADDIAIEERDGFAKGDRADDECDKKQGVNAGHHEQAQVGVRPVVAYRHHDVEGCNAGLFRY